MLPSVRARGSWATSVKWAKAALGLFSGEPVLQGIQSLAIAMPGDIAQAHAIATLARSGTALVLRHRAKSVAMIIESIAHGVPRFGLGEGEVQISKTRFVLFLGVIGRCLLMLAACWRRTFRPRPPASSTSGERSSSCVARRCHCRCDDGRQRSCDSLPPSVPRGTSVHH